MFVIPLDWAQVASPLQKASGDKEKVGRKWLGRSRLAPRLKLKASFAVLRIFKLAHSVGAVRELPLSGANRSHSSGDRVWGQ